MTLVDVSLAGAIVLAIALVAVSAHCMYQLRRVVPQRIQRLEDALRVYNAANASLGRQLAELEASVEAQRAQPAPTVAPMQPEPRPVPEHRAAPSAAQRYGTRPAPDQEFSDAELRLAQLIKSRLSTLRLN